MSKFKVGDLVKGISGRYGITNTNMLVGIVTQTGENYISVYSILHTHNEHGNFGGLLSDCFDFVDENNPVVSKFLYIYNNYSFDFVNNKIYNSSMKDISYYKNEYFIVDFLESLNTIQYYNINKVISLLKAERIYGYKSIRS